MSAARSRWPARVDGRARRRARRALRGLRVPPGSIAAYAIGNGTFPWTEDLPLSTSRPWVRRPQGRGRTLAGATPRRRRFPSVVLRPAAVYGPHDNIPDGEMAMFLRLRQHRPVLVPHEGLVAFNYGHVDDLVDAMVLAATVPPHSGRPSTSPPMR
ncbi:MAG: NAD-dependent epimerase/dehydratase family protein [Acidimicrobiales bacterium]